METKPITELTILNCKWNGNQKRAGIGEYPLLEEEIWKINQSLSKRRWKIKVFFLAR